MRVRRSLLTETLALSLAIVATFAFSLLVVLEWELLGITQSAAPYYFGFTFLLWGLTLLLIGYWYQSRRRSHDQRVTEELRFAYARGDLTTEEYQERRERLRERDEE